MKRRNIMLATALCAALALTGCGQKDQPEAETHPWPATVTYSNLNDQESRQLLAELMTDGGIDGQRQQVLFDHVDQINSFLKPEELTDGFEEVKITEPKYDPYELQERWTEEEPDFMGYNCRITAFSLYGSQVDVPADGEIRSGMVDFDLLSLNEDPAGIPDEQDRERFQVLYSAIPTENTKDHTVHLKTLQDDWQERGIHFEDGGTTSLISVVLHDQVDGDQLFVGHTGVLFEKSENELYFLEKIAFQEPYQLDKFSSRAELSDYLMEKYDVSFDQPTASPMILENDQLIEGYRSHT